MVLVIFQPQISILIDLPQILTSIHLPIHLTVFLVSIFQSQMFVSHRHRSQIEFDSFKIRDFHGLLQMKGIQKERR